MDNKNSDSSEEEEKEKEINEADKTLSFKVVLLGKSGVGKTSILNRYIKNSFSFEQVSTAGANFFSKTYDFDNFNKCIKLEIWDTAGQERYKSLTKLYYKNADSIILVYDITDKDSFTEINNIYKEVSENIDIDKIFFYIVGNKIDLYELEQISKDEANNFALKINANFFTISAKDGIGIELLFENVAKSLFKKSFIENNNKNKLTDSIKIEQIKREKNENKWFFCC